MGVFLERLSAGKSLEAANAQFLLVAEAASVAVFTIDEQSAILFANPFVEQLFGYCPVELIGKKLTLVMPEYLRHVHERGLAHYVATGQRSRELGWHSPSRTAQEWRGDTVNDFLRRISARRQARIHRDRQAESCGPRLTPARV